MRGSCPRCGGLLVMERIRGDALAVLTLSRCVSCGFYTDPVMELNRSKPLPMMALLGSSCMQEPVSEITSGGHLSSTARTGD